MLSSKIPASLITAPDTELFTIRLNIAKATSMDIECIILITDFSDSAGKAVNSSVYFEQAYFLTVCFILIFLLWPQL